NSYKQTAQTLMRRRIMQRLIWVYNVCQCWNRILKAFANMLDPDETPQNVASHQDPNSDDILADQCLPQEFVQAPRGWCGNRILKAFANSLDPDETPQSVARSHFHLNKLE
ncbi:hypothetical protein DPMN_137268, partial [Dreissena polymorpha]